jgi:hypothetical protein
MPEGAIGQSFKVSTGPLPASRKVFVPGTQHSDVRVAMREIDLEPGSKEKPIRAYDPSGPYTDPAVAIDIRAGLAPMREKWILARGDVERYVGRDVKPEDNGLAKRRVRCPSSIAPAASRCVPKAASRCRSSPMRAPASSRRRWNTSPSARISAGRT